MTALFNRMPLADFLAMAEATAQQRIESLTLASWTGPEGPLNDMQLAADLLPVPVPPTADWASRTVDVRPFVKWDRYQMEAVVSWPATGDLWFNRPDRYMIGTGPFTGVKSNRLECRIRGRGLSGPGIDSVAAVFQRQMQKNIDATTQQWDQWLTDALTRLTADIAVWRGQLLDADALTA